MSDQYGPHPPQQPGSETPPGMRPGAPCNSGRAAPYGHGRQPPRTPQQAPNAFVPPPVAQQHQNATTWSTRRKMLAIGLGALPVIGLGAYAATAFASHTSNQASSGGGGFNPGNYNPSTLPSAAGAVNGVSVAAVQGMLAKATTALATGNQQDYVSLFSAAAAQQAPTTFQNMRKFGFSYAQFQLIGSSTRQFDAGDGVSVEMDIAFVHQVTDADRGKIAEWYRWTITKDGSGTPVVSKVTGSPSIDQSLKYTYYPMPWDSPTDIEVVKLGHAVVCAEKPYASAVQQYASTIAAAVEDNRDEWAAAGGPDGIAPGAVYMLGPADQLYMWFDGSNNPAGHAVRRPRLPGQPRRGPLQLHRGPNRAEPRLDLLHLQPGHHQRAHHRETRGYAQPPLRLGDRQRGLHPAVRDRGRSGLHGRP